MPKLWDAHIHTSFSGDSEADPREVAESARSKGLIGMTFTDHLDWDYMQEPGLFDLDIPEYVRSQRALADELSDERFRIAVGIELGLQEHLTGQHHKLLSQYDFDYIIGSIHVVNGRDPYYDPYFDLRTPHECYTEYLEAVLSNIRSFNDIDALGHLDYIVRYATKRYGITDAMLSYAAYEELLYAILTYLIDRDIALEVNTGAFRHGMPEPNPSYEIIRRYRELGGSLITIGSDAHTPADIAIGFDDVQQHLIMLGFSYYVVYVGRKPIEKPL